MTNVVKQQSRLKDLIAKGKEQGYLTYSEVNDHLPEDISDPDQVEDIIQMINDMGITVFVTTHYMDEAEYCDRVSIMLDGEMRICDTPVNLMKKHGKSTMQEVFLQLAVRAKRSD